jgi:hypothetical protein
LLEQKNKALQRERANKLMHVNAATSAIAHEVRQVLTAITATSAAARKEARAVVAIGYAKIC